VKFEILIHLASRTSIRIFCSWRAFRRRIHLSIIILCLLVRSNVPVLYSFDVGPGSRYDFI